MLHKIKTLVASLALVFAFTMPALVPMTASAQPQPPPPAGSPDVQGGVCTGAKTLQIQETNGSVANCTATDANGTDKVNSLIQKIINIISVIVGVVAVVMIIIGGFRYITSGGSSEKVTAAKNTILYALIGLIIVALAQVIVRFVLNKTV